MNKISVSMLMGGLLHPGPQAITQNKKEMMHQYSQAKVRIKDFHLRPDTSQKAFMLQNLTGCEIARIRTGKGHLASSP